MECVVSKVKALEQKALSLLAAFETAGKSVTAVAVEGQRIEFMLSSGETVDEFERIEMRNVSFPSTSTVSGTVSTSSGAAGRRRSSRVSSGRPSSGRNTRTFSRRRTGRGASSPATSVLSSTATGSRPGIGTSSPERGSTMTSISTSSLKSWARPTRPRCCGRM